MRLSLFIKTSLATREIHKVQQENRKGCNKHRKRARKYNVGDVSAIKGTQFGPGLKLAIKFLGPYKVTNVNKKDRYEVERIGDGDGPKVTSTDADFMKPWTGFVHDLEPDDFDSEDDDVEESSSDGTVGAGAAEHGGDTKTGGSGESDDPDGE